MARYARKMKRLEREAMEWCREENKKKKRKEKMKRKREKNRMKRDAAMLMRSPEGAIIKKYRDQSRPRVSERMPSKPISYSEERRRKVKFPQDMMYYVSNDVDNVNGLRVQHFNGTGGTRRVGRSVKAKRDFLKGDFVAYYAYSWDGRGGRVGNEWERRWGELLTREEGFHREEENERQNDPRCFMFFFRTGCIDATNEPPVGLESRVGRLINHSRHNPNGVPGSGPNLEAKMYPVNGRPEIIFKAKRDITAGEFVDYDYGDQSRDGANTWLNATT